MKTFNQFQEAAFAIPTVAGVTRKVLPAAVATVGAIGTFLQAKKKSKDLIKPKKNEAKKTKKLIDKYKKTAKVIRPKEGEIEKQRKLLNKIEKRITKPKKGEKKEALKTVKNYLKARKKEGETMYKLKQDAEIADKGPGDLLPAAKKTYLNKLIDNLKRKRVTEGVASLALKGGSKYVVPLLMTGIGAAGTILQAKRKRQLSRAEKRLHDREMNVRDNDMIRARRGEADKQNKLIDKYEKTQKQQNNLKRRNFIKRLKGDIPEEAMAAPTNSVGDGSNVSLPPSYIPGMRKRKNYAKGGRNSRKPWLDHLKNK